MKKIIRNVAIFSILFVVGLMGWAPWITEEYAYGKVIKHLGGSDVLFDYLGETMPLSEVPKSFVKFPFFSLVYFPGEGCTMFMAIYAITFYGNVI